MTVPDGRSGNCALGNHAGCPRHANPMHSCTCPCHEKEPTK